MVKALQALALVALCHGVQAAAVSADVASLRQEDRHVEAASTGLQILLDTPWDHDLRFMVADSLQRAGRLDEAKAQFAALDGTPLAEAAALRLNALALPGEKLQHRVVSAPAERVTVGPERTAGNAPPRTEAVSSSLRTSRTSLRDRVELPPAPKHLSELDELYAAGDYAAVATRGLALLKRETPDPAVRLKIANSLAWSGRLKAAEAQYQALLQTPLAREGRIGMANAYRWQGRADRALPLYDAVLKEAPDHVDAREGRDLALRELAPRTLVTLGQTRDMNPIERRTLSVAHRWRNRPGDVIYELEAVGDNDSSVTPSVHVARRALTGRIEHLRLPLEPRAELTLRTHPESALFGGLRLRLGQLPAWLHLGRVDWGQLSLSPRAAAAGMSANRIGIEARGNYAWGQLAGQADWYDVSDGNTVTGGSLRYTPSWRPLGAHVRPYAALEFREADQATPEYWSPANGSGSAALGLAADWSGSDWDLYASGQAGKRIYGDAGTSWSLGGGGRYWLERDLALGANFWKMSSWRDNSSYRSHAFALNLEKLWR